MKKRKYRALIKAVKIATLAFLYGVSIVSIGATKHNACPEVNRSEPTFIGHAGWGVESHKYLNSQQGWISGYKKGIRLFESDLMKTSDGVLVGIHNWDEWKRQTGNTSTIKVPNYKLVKDSLIFGKFKTVDAEFIRRFLAEHQDVRLVTDKLDDYKALLDQIGNTDRVLVEVFNEGQIHLARANGYQNVIPSFATDISSVKKYRDNFNVTYFALHSATFDNSFKGRVDLFNDLNVCTFIYSSNDPLYIRESYRDGVYGFYTDFASPYSDCLGKNCDTY